MEDITEEPKSVFEQAVITLNREMGEVKTNQTWIIRILFLILGAVIGQYFL